MYSLVSAARRRHILEGDNNGGGHRHGTGAKGKTEFPKTWDDDKVIREIENVANDPHAKRSVRLDGRTVVEGQREGVDIRVVINADGITIVTAHPTNMPRNP